MLSPPAKEGIVDNSNLLASLSATDGDVESLDGGHLDCYQGDGIFNLNKTKVKMVLEGVALISGLKIMSPAFQPSERDDEPNSRRDFFLFLDKSTVRGTTNLFSGASSLNRWWQGMRELICWTYILKGWSVYLFRV